MAVYPQSRTFLFSGRLDSSGGIVEKTLIPVPGQALSWSAVNGGICFGKTDAYGCIRSVLKGSSSAEQTRFFITRAGDRRWINLIDNNVVSAALFASDGKSDDWLARLTDVVRQAREKQSAEDKKLSVFTVREIDPARDVVDFGDDERKSYFASLPRINGVVLARYCHLVLFLPGKYLSVNIADKNGGIARDKRPVTISIQTPKSQSDTLLGADQYESTELPALILSDPDTAGGVLENGVYTVTVKNINNAKTWYNEKGELSDSYTVSLKVDFNVKTLYGDFAVADATPVSLEESILTRFPAEYAHIRNALENDLPAETPGGEKKTAQSVSARTKARLGEYIKFYKANRERVSLLKSAFGQEDLAPLTKAAFEKFKDSEFLEIQKLYDFGMSIRRFNEEARRIMKAWKFTGAITSALNRAQNMSVLSKWIHLNRAYRVFDKYGEGVADAVIKHGKLRDFRVLTGDNLSAQELFLLRSGQHLDHDGWLAVRKAIDAKPPSFVSRTLNAVDIAVSAAEVFNQFIEINEAAKDVDESFSELIRRAKALYEAGFEAPCRASWQTMEKYRALVSMGYQKLSEAQKAAVMACFDAAIAVVSAYPPTAAAGIIIGAVRTAASSGWELIKNAGELVERHFPSFALSQAYTKSKILNQLSKEGETNFKIARDAREKIKQSAETGGAVPEGVQDILEQIAIRAEAVRALVALIQRVSCRVYFYNPITKAVEYRPELLEKKTKEYRIAEFIDTYLFKSNWLMPVKGTYLPVGLDQVWYLHNQEHAGYSDFSRYQDPGSVGPNAYAIGVQLPEGTKKPEHCAVAGFQKYFPIHTRHIKNISALVEIFSRNYTGIADYVRYSQIYYRIPRKGAAVNDGWTPLVDEAGRITEVTTAMQLRILVVLNTKDDMSAIPATFQLRRTEALGIGIKGPEYNVTCEPLKIGEGGLLPSESRFENYAGVVFFPFYMFRGNCIYGPKPLEFASARKYFDPVTSPDNRYRYIFKFGSLYQPVEFNYRVVDNKQISEYIETRTPSGVMRRQIQAVKNYCDFPFYLRPTDNQKDIDSQMSKSPTFLQSLSQDAPEVPTVARGGFRGIAGLVFKSATGDNGIRLSNDFIYYPPLSKTESLKETVKGFLSDAENMRPGTIFSHSHPSPWFWILFYAAEINEVEWLNSYPTLDGWAKTRCNVTLKQGAAGFEHTSKITSDCFFIGSLRTPTLKKTDRKFLLWRLYSLVDEKSVYHKEWSRPGERTVESAEAKAMLGDLLPILETDVFSSSLYSPKGDLSQALNLHKQIFYFAAKIELSYMENGVKKRGLYRQFKPYKDISIEADALSDRQKFKMNRQLHCI